MRSKPSSSRSSSSPSPGDNEPDLQTYLAYADHLRSSAPARSLPGSGRPGAQITPGIAADGGSDRDDAARHRRRDGVVDAKTTRAVSTRRPRISRRSSIAPSRRSQGFGHLFAGSVDLDRSGNARDTKAGDRARGIQGQRRRLRTSAVKHLKIAAAQLPDVAEAQARYGVALVLAGEQNLGRQFLQTALRLGSLDPQYQLWAAWAILQAGYPEEAEPIVAALLRQVAAGNAPRELEAGLYLLSGEIHQAKRSPDELNKAVADFEKALATGQETSANVVFRLAQIDVQMGQYDRALARIDALKAQGKESPAAEQLAVLTLEQQGKNGRGQVAASGGPRRYPDGADLAGLDAALLNKDGKPAEADRVLAEFLVRQPDNATLVMMRAQIQAESLKNFEQARSLLARDRREDRELGPAGPTGRARARAQSARRRRRRDRQDPIALEGSRHQRRARGPARARSEVSPAEAIEHFDAALRKDPENKIVQYWKAQLDGQNGAVAEATRSLEAIVKNKPIKEVDAGTTLMSAAQSALASLSLRTGALDDAIRRFEELKRSDKNGTLSKADRWQLITAYVARGQWPVRQARNRRALERSQEPPDR